MTDIWFQHAVACSGSAVFCLGEGHGTNTHREANEESLYNAKPSLRSQSQPSQVCQVCRSDCVRLCLQPQMPRSDVCLELGEAPLIKGKDEGEGTALLRIPVTPVTPVWSLYHYLSLGSHLWFLWFLWSDLIWQRNSVTGDRRQRCPLLWTEGKGGHILHLQIKWESWVWAESCLPW